jgi:hypothetical protein
MIATALLFGTMNSTNNIPAKLSPSLLIPVHLQCENSSLQLVYKQLLNKRRLQIF